jgi:hypothetical protein
MKMILSTILAAVVGVALAAQPPAVTAPADLLVVNGKVYTADGRGTFAQAVAVRGHTIAAVGTTQEIERLRGPKTEVVDAAGAAVVPGFNDVHTHMLSGGLALENVELDGAGTLADVQQRIRYLCVGARRPRVDSGRGWQYEPFPGSQPTREQLDAAVAGSAGGDAVLRRPQHLGELEGAGARGHHEGHTRPAARHDRPRSENRRADRPAQGGAGVVTGDQADSEAEPRRRAPRPEGGHRRGAGVRRHQRHRRRRYP